MRSPWSTDEEVLTSELLYDTVEDTDVTIDTLKSQFGDRVAALSLWKRQISKGIAALPKPGCSEGGISGGAAQRNRPGCAHAVAQR